MAAVDGFGLVGELVGGKHLIEAVVAEGGFGTVYRGQQKALKRPVAVKVLKVPTEMTPTMRTAFLESFEREAQTIAQLTHPAIVSVLDYGTTPTPLVGEAPYMVLEWVSGITLQEDLRQRAAAGVPCRTPAECLSLLQPVLEALADAHDIGIAHRDLKPANLMLVPPRRGGDGSETAGSNTTRRGEPQARLLDFGIAKVMQPDESQASGETRTRATMVAFTMPYAAPEQVGGTRTGPWTDVHAMALILTEMLTGHAPFAGADTMELHMDILSPRRPTPAKFGVDVGPWEPVLQRATSVRPGERFSKAGELLAALAANVPAGSQMLPGGAPPIAVYGGGYATGQPVSAPGQVPYNSTVVGVPPAVITGVAMAPAAAKGSRAAIVAVVGVLLIGAVVTVGYKLLGSSEHVPEPVAVTAAARRPVVPAPTPPPTVAVTPPVAPVVAPPVAAPPSPTVAAPVAAPAVAAPALEPVAAHGRHGHGHGHSRPGGGSSAGGSAAEEHLPLN